MVKQLNGIIRKPARPVSIDDMKETVRTAAAGEATRALLGSVPMIERDGRPYYARLADIPQPWQDIFRAALHGSACPVIDGEGECAYASDWSGWLSGSFPRTRY